MQPVSSYYMLVTDQSTEHRTNSTSPPRPSVPTAVLRLTFPSPFLLLCYVNRTARSTLWIPFLAPSSSPSPTFSFELSTEPATSRRYINPVASPMAARADSSSPTDRPSHNPQQPLSPTTSEEQPATPHVHTLLAVDLEPFKQLGILPILVAGWSAFPAFMLLLTTSLNFLYTHFAPFLLMIETEPQSIESFAAITVRVLLLLFACRNIIAFS